MRAVLTRAALADIEKAATWYEGRQLGLGSSFVECVEQAIERISAAPFSYAPVIEDVRRVNVPRFPYALWYRLQDDAVVIACLHSKRDPALAKERALGVLQMPDPK